MFILTYPTTAARSPKSSAAYIATRASLKVPDDRVQRFGPLLVSAGLMLVMFAIFGRRFESVPRDNRGPVHFSYLSLSLVARNAGNAQGPDLAPAGLGLDILLFRSNE